MPAKWGRDSRGRAGGVVPGAQGVRAWARGGCGCGARRAALLLEGTDSQSGRRAACARQPREVAADCLRCSFLHHSSLGNLCVQSAKLLCDWQLHSSEDHRCRGVGADDRESSSRIAIS